MSHWKCLSGSGLKLIAVASMLSDHLAALYLRDISAMRDVWFSIGHRAITPYSLMRVFGRLAFPIFAFLLVEGFLHTRNRLRYGINLFVFAVLSEIPWNLVHEGTLCYQTQNVFFTLLIGYLGLCAIDHFKDIPKRQLVCLVGLLIVAVFLRADYGCGGYGFILLLYVLREQKIMQAVIGSCVLNSRWVAGLAFIPISMYNGERGFVKGAVAKYAFYLFYPLHLVGIYFLCYW